LKAIRAEWSRDKSSIIFLSTAIEKKEEKTDYEYEYEYQEEGT